MSKYPNLPIKSELYNQSKNKEDFVTLNIYNQTKEVIEDSNYDNNQTEANLNVGNNNPINKKDDPLDNLRKNAMHLDNTRQNPYPFSENRGVNKYSAAPPILNKEKNNFSKSMNPYFQDKNINIKDNLNNVPISTEKEIKQENHNIQTVKYEKYLEKQNKEPKKKKTIIWGLTLSQLILCMVMSFVLWPVYIIVCIIKPPCNDKKNGDE